MVCWMFDFDGLKSVLLEYPHDVIDFSIMYNHVMQPYYSRLALWVQLINLDQSFIEATSSSIVMRVDCNMLGGPEKEEKEAFSWMSNAHLTSPEELSVRPMGHCRHIMQMSFFLCEIPCCHNVCVFSIFLWQQCWLLCQALTMLRLFQTRILNNHCRHAIGEEGIILAGLGQTHNRRLLHI